MPDVAHPLLRQVVIDTKNPRVSAEFWRQVLGLVYREGHEPPGPGDDDRRGREWLNLLTPDGSPCLAFQGVDDLTHTTWPDPTIPQQLHLDTSVRDVQVLEAVHERVLALGGTLRLDRSDDDEEPLRAYVDPDGHTFCVFVVDEP